MDPTQQGVVKWSAERAHQHLQAVIPASIGIPVAALIVGQFIALPKHPTTADRIVQGIESLVAGVLIVALLILIYAVAVAPYEQRNELRRRLVDVADSNDEMHWADERRAVYAAYLDAVWPWMAHIRHWESRPFDEDATVESHRAEEGQFDWKTVSDAMTEPLAEIGLIGSKEAESAVRSLGAQLIAFEATLIPPISATLEGLQRMAAECEKRYQRVRRAFRKDLGLSSAEPVGGDDLLPGRC